MLRISIFKKLVKLECFRIFDPASRFRKSVRQATPLGNPYTCFLLFFREKLISSRYIQYSRIQPRLESFRIVDPASRFPKGVRQTIPLINLYKCVSLSFSRYPLFCLCSRNSPSLYFLAPKRLGNRTGRTKSTIFVAETVFLALVWGSTRWLECRPTRFLSNVLVRNAIGQIVVLGTI